MKRRSFLKSTPLLAAMNSCSPALLEDRRKRPNILLAISDDQSWAHTGSTGDRVVRTPAFDEVAERGGVFEHAFCSSPSCSPSRASVLTGQDFWRLESGGNLYGELPEKFPVYPLLLRQAGYAVGYTGKGRFSQRELHPCGREYNELSASPPTRAMSSIDYAGNFRNFLAQRSNGQPFCFWYGGAEPHRPYSTGPGRSERDAEEIPVPPFLPDLPPVRREIGQYYREIEWFDRHLGLMIDELKRRGELENTLIVVTSDNGMPFPRAKTNLYDFGVRMPLAICWQERFRGRREFAEFVNLTDLAPTFLRAAGLSPPDEVTGRSLLSLMESPPVNENRIERRRVYVGRERHGYNREPNVGYPMRAVRTRRYLYIRNYAPERWPMVDHNLRNPVSELLMGHGGDQNWKRLFELAFAPRPGEELYELGEDPYQMQNLAGRVEVARVQGELKEELERYLRKSGDPRALGEGARFDRYEYHGPRTGNQEVFRTFRRTLRNGEGGG